MTSVNRLSSSALVALAFAVTAACSSPSPEGCSKDTDCASGRVCGGEGRCVDRDATASTTTTTPTAGGPQGDPPAPTPSPSPSPATGGTLVDRCSANVSCTIDNQILKKIESCTGHLSEVDGKCFFVRTEGTDTFEDILGAGGGVVDRYGGVVGAWTSDTAHFVVNIGGGNIVYDCR